VAILHLVPLGKLWPDGTMCTRPGIGNMSGGGSDPAGTRRNNLWAYLCFWTSFDSRPALRRVRQHLCPCGLATRHAEACPDHSKVHRCTVAMRSRRSPASDLPHRALARGTGALIPSSGGAAMAVMADCIRKFGHEQSRGEIGGTCVGRDQPFNGSTLYVHATRRGCPPSDRPS
jgi:hypothetical protein